MIESEKTYWHRGRKTNTNLSFCNIRLNMVRQAASIFFFLFKCSSLARGVGFHQLDHNLQTDLQTTTFFTHGASLKTLIWIELNICCRMRNCSNLFCIYSFKNKYIKGYLGFGDI